MSGVNTDNYSTHFQSVILNTLGLKVKNPDFYWVDGEPVHPNFVFDYEIGNRAYGAVCLVTDKITMTRTQLDVLIIKLQAIRLRALVQRQAELLLG